MKNKFKTQGIVCQRTNYGESSLIVRVFTSEHGLISFIAKGIRKSNADLSTLFNIMNEIELVLYEPNTSGLYLFAEGSLIQVFDLHKRIEIWTAAECGIELIQNLIIESSECIQYYNLLKTYLTYLQDVNSNAIAIYWRFWLRVFHLLGIGFNLLICCKCKSSESIIVGWDSLSGLPVCRNCQSELVYDTQFKQETVKIINILNSIGNHLNRITITSSVAKEINNFFLHYHSVHYNYALNLKCLSIMEEVMPH